MSSAAPTFVQKSPNSAPTAKSPDSDISPGTQGPDSSHPADYFSPGSISNNSSRVPSVSAPAKTHILKPDFQSMLDGTSKASSNASLSRSSDDGPDDSGRPSTVSRKSSIASVTFRQPRNPSLPQGVPRKTDNQRLRASSPSPVR
ncbi:hypothetical protein V8F06_000708 [Rhypophila decipiens]